MGVGDCSAQRHGSANEKNYIKACDKEGNTALHLAVQNGSTEVNCHLSLAPCTGRMYQVLAVE